MLKGLNDIFRKKETEKFGTVGLKSKILNH